jgi:1-deoxy-D-xylulose-5-phosphate reductoisomerase
MASVVEEVLTELSGEPGTLGATMTLDNVAAIDHLARARTRAFIDRRAV